jgi:hypothetical protein
MKPLVLVLGVLALLAACSSGPEGKAWYEEGDANYDAVKTAHDACVAKGGTFQVKPQGDPTHLGDYECIGATK